MAQPLASLAIDSVAPFTPYRIGRLLMEYLEGPSPNDQFFSQHTDWIGIGLHPYY
ncbi:MAG: DUF1207 domain-containing protein [Nitrospira sp.]|nr:DUF1207 domain-containing protein [Nitrospira sp.]